MNDKQASVAARVAELACMPMSELWTVWDRYFPSRPDYPNRTHVESRIAYKLQEEAFGGLARETKQRLEAIGAKHSKIKLRAQGDGHRRGAIRVRRAHVQESDCCGSPHHRHALEWSPVLRSADGRDAMSEIAASKAPKRCAVYCRVGAGHRADAGTRIGAPLAAGAGRETGSICG